MSKATEYRRIPSRSIPKPIILKNNEYNNKRSRTTTEYNDKDLSLKFIIIISEILGNNIYFQKNQKLKGQKNYLI
jgi:hypothetical protein